MERGKKQNANNNFNSPAMDPLRWLHRSVVSRACGRNAPSSWIHRPVVSSACGRNGLWLQRPVVSRVELDTAACYFKSLWPERAHDSWLERPVVSRVELATAACCFKSGAGYSGLLFQEWSWLQRPIVSRVELATAACCFKGGAGYSGLLFQEPVAGTAPRGPWGLRQGP